MPPDASQAASGPAPSVTKPTLAERIAAMEAKHSGRAGQAVAADAGPERTEPITHAQAQANLEAGLDVSWVRHFRRFQDTDGEWRWVDDRTGETYDAMPKLHSADGSNV